MRAALQRRHQILARLLRNCRLRSPIKSRTAKLPKFQLPSSADRLPRSGTACATRACECRALPCRRAERCLLATLKCSTPEGSLSAPVMHWRADELRFSVSLTNNTDDGHYLLQHLAVRLHMPSSPGIHPTWNFSHSHPQKTRRFRALPGPGPQLLPLSSTKRDSGASLETKIKHATKPGSQASSSRSD